MSIKHLVEAVEPDEDNDEYAWMWQEEPGGYKAQKEKLKDAGFTEDGIGLFVSKNDRWLIDVNSGRPNVADLKNGHSGEYEFYGKTTEECLEFIKKEDRKYPDGKVYIVSELSDNEWEQGPHGQRLKSRFRMKNGELTDDWKKAERFFRKDADKLADKLNGGKQHYEGGRWSSSPITGRYARWK